MTREIDRRLAESLACRMLSAALQRAAAERGLSMRKIGAMLGYKQAVVLSHMASGRVPIPIDRAENIAKVLELDAGKFLRAVLDQRFPTVTWDLITGGNDSSKADSLTSELEIILNSPLAALTSDQRRVLREVAADPSPGRRWLSVHELPLMKEMRAHRESDRDDELSEEETDAILASLRGPGDP